LRWQNFRFPYSSPLSAARERRFKGSNAPDGAGSKVQGEKLKTESGKLKTNAEKLK
jgi:hypothetical protein